MSTRIQIVAVALLVGGLVLVAVLSFLGAASVRSEIADLREEQRVQAETLATKIDSTEVLVEIPEEAVSVTSNIEIPDELMVQATVDFAPLLDAYENLRQAFLTLAESELASLDLLTEIRDNQLFVTAYQSSPHDLCDELTEHLDDVLEDMNDIAVRFQDAGEARFIFLDLYLTRFSALQVISTIWNCEQDPFGTPLSGFYNPG